MKAADYGNDADAVAAFVATNSICQGAAGADPLAVDFRDGHRDRLCSYIFQMGKSRQPQRGRDRCDRRHCRSIECNATALSFDGRTAYVKRAININAYLVPGQNIIVDEAIEPHRRSGHDGYRQ